MSTLGRRTQRCRGCSQTAARRPAGITPNDRKVQRVQLFGYRTVIDFPVLLE